MTKRSFKVPSNKFSLERGETTTSILNSDVSTSQNMSVSFNNSLENLAEDQVEMKKNRKEKTAPNDTMTAQEAVTESRGDKICT